MKRCYELVLKDIDAKLSELSKEEYETIATAKKVINLMQKSFWELKELVKQNGFDCNEEEIEFFKFVKPKICGRLIYYCRILKLELKRPQGSLDLIREYYQKYLNILNDHFYKNGEFVEYMRSGATYIDRYFFLRSKQDYKVIPEHFMFDKDSEFSTSHDFKAAELIAYEFLCTYLNKQINNPELIDSFDFNKRLKWTKPKTALVELIYALYVSACFNNGDVSIKEIASFFEKAFKIDLGDYYRVFIEIAKRKNHRAKFLETILINFEQKLIETDK